MSGRLKFLGNLRVSFSLPRPFPIDKPLTASEFQTMKLALAALLILCGLAAAAVTEESLVHAGTTFRVVKVAPEQLNLVWKDKAGVPYRNFENVQAAFAKQGKKVTFIMNAGIFEPGGIPSGLHVEDRKPLHPLNLALGCDNALFLDGDISQMAVNPTGPIRSNEFGAMFVVSE